jgi:hypothetical protein
MEEIEIMSWLTLDALKKKAKVMDTVGNLQTGHSVSVFGVIEEDYLELYYSDSAANYLRRYENRDELEAALGREKKRTAEPITKTRTSSTNETMTRRRGREFESRTESDGY